MHTGRIHRAVLISALIHAALFGTFLYIAYHGSTDVPGDDGVGEMITVSLVTGDGGVNSAGKSMEVERSAPVKTSVQKFSSQMTTPTKTPIATEESSSGSVASSTNSPQPTPGSRSGRGDPRLLSIWKKINRSKYYPLNARRNSLKGDPRVTFKTGEQGQIEYVKLAKSCGIAELDDAAVETVRRAAPLPYYPNPITLTIRYSMND